MTTLLFQNDASTTLQAGLTTASTSCTVAAGTGSVFPAPTSGQAFYLTFLDASTQQIKEIVLCTSRSGDVLQIQRAQQGTSALTWNAGDLAVQLVTAGDVANGLQPDELQKAVYTVCNGSGSNSITATLESGLTALPSILQFTVIAAAANTGNVTLTLTLGLELQSSAPVLKFGGSQLNPGDIPEAGFPIELTWVSALGAYIMTNPATSSAGSIAGGASNELLVQTAPGSTGFVLAPSVAGQVLAFVGGIIQWIAAAVTSFNGRSGAVTPQAGDYTAAQVGAVSTASVTGPNQQVLSNGFQVLPGGVIIQWGRYVPTVDVSTVAFPKIFPGQCFIVIPTGYTNDPDSSTNVQASGYQTGGPVGSFTLRAEGNERPVVWFAIGN